MTMGKPKIPKQVYLIDNFGLIGAPVASKLEAMGIDPVKAITDLPLILSIIGREGIFPKYLQSIRKEG